MRRTDRCALHLRDSSAALLKLHSARRWLLEAHLRPHPPRKLLAQIAAPNSPKWLLGTPVAPSLPVPWGRLGWGRIQLWERERPSTPSAYLRLSPQHPQTRARRGALKGQQRQEKSNLHLCPLNFRFWGLSDRLSEAYPERFEVTGATACIIKCTISRSPTNC
jgi:hypothetical protein